MPTTSWPRRSASSLASIKDGVLPHPQELGLSFPQPAHLARWSEVIEQKLFVMYLAHRMRVFQGTFHGSPDYALWYGWNEMRRDLTGIKELAETMRENRTTAQNAK